MYYVYMLSCGDGSLYTGIAANVEKRLRQQRLRRKTSKLSEAVRYKGNTAQSLCRLP